MLDSRKSSFEADITVEYGSCSADAIKLEDIVFNVVPASGVTGGSPDQLDGAAHMTFANLGTVAATEESLLATIKIQGGPCADGHQINQEIKIYVPEKPAEQYMMWLGVFHDEEIIYDLVPNIDMVWESKIKPEMIPAEVKGSDTNPITDCKDSHKWAATFGDTNGGIYLICEKAKESEIALAMASNGVVGAYDIEEQRQYFEKDGKEWFVEVSFVASQINGGAWTVKRG